MITVEVADGPGNARPVANDDVITLDARAESLIPFETLLANDTDDGVSQPLVINEILGAGNATVELAANGIRFTPDPDAGGTAAFGYIANDGFFSVTAFVTVVLTAGNADPVAAPDTATTPVLIDALSHDTEADGDTLLLDPAGFTAPANGTVTVEDGVIRYAPNDGFAGEDTFTYTVGDGNGGVATGTVSVTVEAPVETVDTVNGTRGADELAGTDVFFGGSGNDRIDGGEGLDTAIVRGSKTVGFFGLEVDALRVLPLDEDSFLLLDLNPFNGNDGLDRLDGVERVTFRGNPFDPGDDETFVYQNGDFVPLVA